MTKNTFYTLFIFYIASVLYLSISTPISPHEAKLFYTSTEMPSLLMHWGAYFFEGFFGLRVFFVFFGFLTIYLFYKVSRLYLVEKKDSYMATTLFMFLPGVLTATILVNISIVVLPLVLFFILMYEKNHFWSLPLVMGILFMLHDASIIFFVALVIYSIIYRDHKLLFFASLFLLAFILFAKGIEIGGRPSGHFVDIFGLYATVFSPLVFLYFFYTMYRILLREKKTLLWYISFTALAFSLLLSIRQRVYITDFAPYVTIAIILMLQVYNDSVRVRLKVFQKRYYRTFKIVIASLMLSVVIIVFHKPLFYLSTNPSTHFAKRIYKPYILAQELHSNGIECYDDAHGRERYQLKYYKIVPCNLWE